MTATPTTSNVAPRAPRRAIDARRHGLALVVAMAVVLAIASLLIVFARQMQTQALAERNHVSAVQARLIAQGVVQAIRADLSQSMSAGNPPRPTLVKSQAVRLGSGVYWIIQPNYDDDRTQAFGIVPLGGRIDLNTADPTLLDALVDVNPDMTTDIAASIADWADSDDNARDGGAESPYYLSLTTPYNAKNGPFESFEELRLVKGVTDALMYGEDANRNGVLDPNEDDGDQSPPNDNRDGALTRGIFDYTTVFSSQPTTAGSGGQRVNLNSAQSADLVEAFTDAVGQARANDLAAAVMSLRPFRGVLDFYARSGVTEDEANALSSVVTTQTGDTVQGLIDANAAPAAVFDMLPGLELGDGQKLVDARKAVMGEGLSSSDATTATAVPSLYWVFKALGASKASAVSPYLTNRSYQFSADIVAVSGDGRAFYRLYVVIDAAPSQAQSGGGSGGDTSGGTSGGTASASASGPRVVYAQDLTHLGWPLNPQILADLRSGKTADEVASTYGAGS